MAKKPFPQFCMPCWNCAYKPNTVGIAAIGSSGDLCCSWPNGTFTVGAASSSTLSNNNTTSYDRTTHEFTTGLSASTCRYTWNYIVNTTQFGCGGGASCGEFQTLFAPPGQYALAKCAEGCDIEGVATDGWAVLLQEVRVHCQWALGPLSLLVVIHKRYNLYQCHPSFGGNVTTLRDILIVHDEYYYEPTDCSDMPSSINFTSRWGKKTAAAGAYTENLDTMQKNISSTPVTVYTACTAEPSVALTYA